MATTKLPTVIPAIALFDSPPLGVEGGVLMVFVAVGVRVLEVELVELPPASVTVDSVVEVVADTGEDTRFVLIAVAELSADGADGMVITRATDLNLLLDKVELAESTEVAVKSIALIVDSSL